jgi:hypothetical protein
MGGLVFDDSGAGLLTAGYFMTTPSVLVQMSTSFSGGDYYLGSLNMANGSTPYNYTTRRHFGMARSSSGTIALAWRGTSGARSMVTAVKTSISSGAAFGTPADRISYIVNGVDIAYAPTTNTFLAGLSW